MGQRYTLKIKVSLSGEGLGAPLPGDEVLETLGQALADALGGGAVVLPRSDGHHAALILTTGLELGDSATAAHEDVASAVRAVLSSSLEEAKAVVRRELKTELLAGGATSAWQVKLSAEAAPIDQDVASGNSVGSSREQLEIEDTFELALSRTRTRMRERLARAVAMSAASLMTGMMAACGTAPEPTTVQADNDHAELEATLDASGQAPMANFDSQTVGILYSFKSDAAGHGITPHPAVDLRAIRFVDKFPAGALADGEMPLAMCLGFTGHKGDGSSVRWREVQILKPELADQYEDFDLHWLIYHALGHCLLEKGNSPTDKEGIMAPSLFMWQTHSEKEWTGMVDELFSPQYQESLPDLHGTVVRPPAAKDKP